MSLMHFLRDPGEDWPYTPQELPAVFGAPANVTHPLQRRIAYGLTGLLVGITGSLGSALVLVNQPQLQGALGLYAYEIAWLPTAYVIAIIPMNLLLVKFRKQFGLRMFVVGTVAIYAVVMLAHLSVHSFASSIAVRAASGMVASAFTTQSIFYMAQALPIKWRLQAIVIGLGIPQLSFPLARCVFSTELLALGEWRSLYMCELGLTLLSLGAVLMFTLPPAPRAVTYERLDFLTFGMFAGGAAALSAVIGLGRYLWWLDTPWLGYCLLVSIPLLVGAVMIERRRVNPLLALNLLASGPFIRFVVLSVLLQIAIAEQTIGAVGLMSIAGLSNDQLHPLFGYVTLAMIVGILASAILLKPERFAHRVALAFGAIFLAGMLDSQVTHLSRPEQLYLSQILVGFATTFGLGPLFLLGLRQALPQGPAAFISFLAAFSMTANLGALGANSLVGSYEILQEKAHSHYLVENVVPTDPQVVVRLGDVTQLTEHVTRESSVLAYIDVFRMTAGVALLSGLYLLVLIVWRRGGQAAS